MVIDWKEQTKRQWNATPCGSTPASDGLVRESLEWFEKLRSARYASDPWMLRVMPFKAFAGRDLLEVGYGIGSDLITFAQNGAQVHGIDITPEHHRLAQKNFELRSLPAELKLCDASQIEYPNERFDVVYSHGVLHHTPDIEQCVSEMHRVLKPSGTLILSIYHTWSAFHLCRKVLYHGLWRGDLRRLGYRGVMATSEAGADGARVKPLVRTYSKRQVRRLLRRFQIEKIEVAHFDRSHIPHLGEFLPERMLPLLERRFGWYVVAFARKPESPNG